MQIHSRKAVHQAHLCIIVRYPYDAAQSHTPIQDICVKNREIV